MPNTAQPQRWPSSREEGSAGSASAPNVVPIRIDEDEDPLDSFNSESDSEPPAPTVPGGAAVPPGSSPGTGRRHGGIAVKWLIPLCVVVALGAVAAFVVFARSRGVSRPSAAPVGQTGHVALNTRPDGATVLVDGVNRGVTPIELDLAPGTHAVVLLAGTSQRRLDLKVEGGVRVSENVDLPLSVQAAVGALDITSEPAGARVTLDGTAVGVTPLSLKNVNPARHSVAIASGTSTINRTVDVAAGATASVFVTLAAQGGPATGTLAVESPIDLRIQENGQLLGLSNGAPIVLSSGRHQLDLINDGLEVRVSRPVTVDSGKSTRLNVPVPSGTLSVNASPWAEVFVDGRSIGTTPLGDVSLPVGSHEVVWRHPQLGEKRRTVVVGAQTPTRVAMDLTR